MRAATIDNVRIGAPWVPVLDHSCEGGPLSLTLDRRVESRREVLVQAEVSWSTVRGRAVAIVDVPTVLTLGASCVQVRARALGSEAGAEVSVSAQVVVVAAIARTHPTYTARVAAGVLDDIRSVPHWARRLRVHSTNVLGPLLSWIELYGDEAGVDVLARVRLNEPVAIAAGARWERIVSNVDADLTMIWTLAL